MGAATAGVWIGVVMVVARVVAILAVGEGVVDMVERGGIGPGAWADWPRYFRYTNCKCECM